MQRQDTAPPPVRVSKSAVHGRGLFATRDIPADTLILRAEGKPTKRNGPHVIWWEDALGVQGLRITNEARFVNHSRDPNAAFYDLELWSLRDIRARDEITHDYGADWADIG